MRIEGVGDEVVRLSTGLAGLVVSVPVVAGFVVLGAAVLIGRSAGSAARWARALLPWGRDGRREQRGKQTKAA